MKLARVRPNPDCAWQSSAWVPIGQTLAEIGPTPVHFGPNAVEVSRKFVDTGQNLAEFGGSWANSAQIWPHSTQCFPIPGKTVEIGSEQVRLKSPRIGLNYGQLRAVDFRPMPAFRSKLVAMPAQVWPCRPFALSRYPGRSRHRRAQVWALSFSLRICA